MAIDKNVLRDQLRNFRTRANAIQEAAVAGEESLEAAISLLHDRTESVRWSAIRILREISDMRAMGPLIELLEQGLGGVDAANALRSITGEDFGDDAEAWRTWAQGVGGVELVPGAGSMSDEDLIAAATRDLDAETVQSGSRFLITVAFDNERTQKVCVDFDGKDAQDENLVRLYTPCGEAVEEKYEWALKSNMRLPYGAIALAKMEGALCFVMIDAYPRATVTPEILAKALRTLAKNGDGVEKMLTGEDNY